MLSCSDAAMKVAGIYKFGIKQQRQLEGRKYRNVIQTYYNSGASPSLLVMRDAFGDDYLHGWMEMNILIVASLAGNDKKPNAFQIATCANSLVSKFTGEYNESDRLNAAEVLLYFRKVIAGDFGEFYGAVNIMTLGKWADQYLDWLHSERASVEEEQRRRREVEECMALDETCELSDEERREVREMIDKLSGSSRLAEPKQQSMSDVAHDDASKQKFLDELPPELRNRVIEQNLL